MDVQTARLEGEFWRQIDKQTDKGRWVPGNQTVRSYDLQTSHAVWDGKTAALLLWSSETENSINNNPPHFLFFYLPNASMLHCNLSYTACPSTDIQVRWNHKPDGFLLYSNSYVTQSNQTFSLGRWRNREKHGPGRALEEGSLFH